MAKSKITELFSNIIVGHQKEKTLKGKLGSGKQINDPFTVAGKPGYVWVRVFRGGVQSLEAAINEGCALIPDLPVVLELNDNSEYAIKKADSSTVVQVMGDVPGASVAPHTHDLTHGNADFVETQRILEGLLRVFSGLIIEVLPINNWNWNGTTTFFGGLTYNLTADLPVTTNTQRWVKLGLNITTKAIETVDGDEVSLLTPLTISDLALLTFSTNAVMPIAGVKLRYGATSIVKITDIADIRPWLSGSSGASPDSLSGAPYITSIPSSDLSNEFALATLATGILKNITTTGIPVIATAGVDFLSPSGSETISNKLIDNTNTITLKDSLFTLQDNLDITKQAAFQLANITTGQLRTYTVPDYDGTFATIAGIETLTNKTLTTPTISSLINATHNHQNSIGGGQLSASSVFSAGQVPVARGGTGADLSAAGAGFLKQVASGANITVTAVDLSGADATGILAAARFPALTGDITTVAGALATVLATVNASPGAYALATVTVNGKGLVTSATAASTTGSGAVVLTTSPTIVTPTVADFTNATHSHQNAAGGGTLDAAAIASGTLNNSRVNWAAPGTIGSTTPNTGAFTTLTTTGNATIGVVGASAARLNVNAAASAVGLIVRLGSSGTSNLQEWQANSGTIMLSINSDGGLQQTKTFSSASSFNFHSLTLNATGAGSPTAFIMTANVVANTVGNLTALAFLSNADGRTGNTTISTQIKGISGRVGFLSDTGFTTSIALATAIEATSPFISVGGGTISVTNMYGVRIVNQGTAATAGVTFTTVVGLQIEDQTNGTNVYSIRTNAGKVRFGDSVAIGSALITPTAYLHIAAGTTAASTGPLKFTSTSNVLTTPEVGVVEFTTDDLFFTITTGAARKRLLMADAVGGLTSGRVPYGTTNGRLTDSTNLTFDGTTVTIATLAKPTTYNGVTTEGFALSTIIDSVSLTGQTTDIGTTNCSSASVAGLYRVSAYLQDTTADIAAGVVSLTFTWTDDVGSTTQTITQTLATTGRSSIVFFVRLASGNLTYATTHTGVILTSAYAVHFIVERLT